MLRTFGMLGNTASERVASQLQMSPVPDNAMVEAVVRAVFSTLRGDLSSREAVLLAEVEALGLTIATAKAEIAALRVDDITDSHIPSATDELDAIVTHTATATDCILEVCEALDTLSGTLPDPAARVIGDATTRIYEACSFQDITGQRITKVVLALKAIEEKVAHVLHTFGRASGPKEIVQKTATQPAGALLNGPLLNGPQLPLAAMGQSEIDKLLASFE